MMYIMYMSVTNRNVNLHATCMRTAGRAASEAEDA